MEETFDFHTSRSFSFTRNLFKVCFSQMAPANVPVVLKHSIGTTLRFYSQYTISMVERRSLCERAAALFNGNRDGNM